MTVTGDCELEGRKQRRPSLKDRWKLGPTTRDTRASDRDPTTNHDGPPGTQQTEAQAEAGRLKFKSLSISKFRSDSDSGGRSDSDSDGSHKSWCPGPHAPAPPWAPRPIGSEAGPRATGPPSPAARAGARAKPGPRPPG